MKKNVLLFVFLFCFENLIYSQLNKFPFQDSNLTVEERLNDLVNRMTIEEKIDLLAGYNDFYLHPCERLGIPAFKMADGPLGVSSWGLWGRATAFPSALSVASSWNRNLAYQLGQVYAEEWRSRGIHFMLAPGVNIYRSSKGARNFEYYGEDPYLTSELIVPFIKGVQEGGVIATIKHFVGNDQEFDRYTVSTEMSERALHEIYLPPFKAAVEKAHVGAVMTGYNPFRGVYCTENKHVIDILKHDWEFDGILMSDWACTYSADKAANHGLDLEMGSKSWFNKEKLLPLIDKGIVEISTIDDKVRRIYGTCMRMGFFDRPQKDDNLNTYNTKANELALKAAEEGIILLKNDKLLPLGTPKSIAVIGPTANPALINDRVFSTNGIVYGGGGSSRVHPWYVINDLQGLKNEFCNSKILYSEGISNQFKSQLFKKSKFITIDGESGLIAKYFRSNDNSTEGLVSDLLLEQAKAAGREVLDNTKSKLSDIELNTDSNLVFERVDRNVNFEWWGAPDNNSKLGTEYSIQWEGFVEIEKNDSLRFFVDAQGGYQLWINDNLAVDASKSESFHVSNKAFYFEKNDKVKVLLKYNNQRALPSEIRMGYCYDSDIDFSEVIDIASKSDIAVVCVGLDGSIELEGRDRPFDLPFGQDLLIKEISKVNKNVIVVIHAGGGVNMTRWIDSVPVVLHALYSGQEGGNALAHIISGKTNPSAKLPFTIEKYWEDSPAFGNYDETRKSKKIFYNEGIFVGYRGYEKNKIEPLFPFGFGLSYAEFDYKNLKVDIDRKQKNVKISLDITNIGNVEGAEVVQFYVTDIKSKVERPIKELKGFEKVKLFPGETKNVSVTLNEDDFKYFNEDKNSWVLEKGEFIINVGKSSRNIVLKEKIRL